MGFCGFFFWEKKIPTYIFYPIFRGLVNEFFIVSRCTIFLLYMYIYLDNNVTKRGPDSIEFFVVWKWKWNVFHRTWGSLFDLPCVVDTFSTLTFSLLILFLKDFFSSLFLSMRSSFYFYSYDFFSGETEYKYFFSFTTDAK